MQRLARLRRRFARDETGATAVEYALIAGLVVVGALGGMIALGAGVGESWNATAQRVTDAMGGQ